MSFADMAVLFVLALLLFGPKKLPGIARQVGKILNEFKRASNEFKAQIESEINQLEFQERKEAAEKEKQPEQKILPPVAPPDSVASRPAQAEPAQTSAEEPAPISTEHSAEFNPSAASNEVDSVTSSNSSNA